MWNYHIFGPYNGSHNLEQYYWPIGLSLCKNLSTIKVCYLQYKRYFQLETSTIDTCSKMGSGPIPEFVKASKSIYSNK